MICIGSLPTDDTSTVVDAEKRLDIGVAMRDGVELATDVYLPEGTGPRPALLMRTPYNKTRDVVRIAPYLRAGYTVAVQDVRGRHESGGDWRPFFSEGEDGYDTIGWLADQPWCDGNVGTFGASYAGWTQWAAARLRPPALRAMAVAVTAGRWMQQEVWHNGAVFLAALNWHAFVSGRGLQATWLADWKQALWHLPLRELDAAVERDLPAWREWLDHPTLDEYWAPLVYTDTDFAAVDVPVLHVSGWLDGNLGASVFFYEGMRRHSPAGERQALVLGPWDHRGAGADVTPDDVGPAAAVDMGATRVAWFDRWLRAAPAHDAAGSRVFVSGTDEWREAETWPPVTEEVTWWVGEGTLTTDAPAPGSMGYAYDPADPVILFDDWDGYGPWTNPELPASRPYSGAVRLLERADALAYTSPPLAANVEVSGVPRARLYASTDGPDTDWFVWVHDVHEDGTSEEISRGHVRGRFRVGLDAEVLLEPGRVYEYDIELSPISHVFRVGHRIRMVVSSSNFPRYDRNLNTGEPIADGTLCRIARNTVHHGPAFPSGVRLPVVGRS